MSRGENDSSTIYLTYFKRTMSRHCESEPIPFLFWLDTNRLKRIASSHGDGGNNRPPSIIYIFPKNPLKLKNKSLIWRFPRASFFEIFKGLSDSNFPLHPSHPHCCVNRQFKAYMYYIMLKRSIRKKRRKRGLALVPRTITIYLFLFYFENGAQTRKPYIV